MKFLSLFFWASLLLTCQSKKSNDFPDSEYPTPGLIHPEWSRNATIYELNIRQYTPEGTILGVIPHLERLRNMGIDILWLMPIHPIGELNRKGTLGSYYSVRDYKAVNPDFGTKEDFKIFMQAAHDMGFKVILDWVANHTAWDHPWMKNEGWYQTDSLGNVRSPVPDWSDVAQLNLENPEVRSALIDAMKYWLEEFYVDGYRCDVAGMVPLDFWNEARKKLDQIKPVFMLAEAEQPEQHESAFDMSYGWELMHIMNEIEKGNKNVNDIGRYMEREVNRFPKDSYRMYFTTTHDENSWNGTVFERYGENYEAFAVLSSTIHGVPLLYSGQEAGLDWALKFFEKDEIDWSELKYEDFFTTLFQLNRSNEALWNGSNGGEFKLILSDSVSQTLVFSRQKGDNAVIVALNFADQEVAVHAETGLSGDFMEVFSGLEMTDPLSLDLSIEPHGYRLIAK
jgi:glycosidase